jgi:hypothetical protein
MTGVIAIELNRSIAAVALLEYLIDKVQPSFPFFVLFYHHSKSRVNDEIVCNQIVPFGSVMDKTILCKFAVRKAQAPGRPKSAVRP